MNAHLIRNRKLWIEKSRGRQGSAAAFSRVVRYLTAEEVILIHERILEKFGGAGGLRDWNLLDSAVQRPRAAFSGKDLYPDLFTKAAALGHSLVLDLVHDLVYIEIAINGGI